MKSSSTTILNHCVNLAIGGRSFKMFNDPDMQGILKCALEHTKETTNINPAAVCNGVSSRAAELRQKIVGRIKGHMVKHLSVKISSKLA